MFGLPELEITNFLLFNQYIFYVSKWFFKLSPYKFKIQYNNSYTSIH